MSSPSEVQQKLRKHLNDLKRKIKADEKLRGLAIQEAKEDMDYNVKVEKVYKPFVENLDRQLVPLKRNTEGVLTRLKPTMSYYTEKLRKELVPIQKDLQETKALTTNLKQDIDEYNTNLREMHNTNQEQLAIDYIPEKYLNVIGNLAKRYLANRDKLDSLGLKWDEDDEVFKLGTFVVNIDGSSNIQLYDPATASVKVQLPATEGLWMLLTQKNPYRVGEPRLKWSQVVTKNDIELYRRWMYLSKACYKEGKNGWNKRSSTATKWVEIIKPYLEQKEREMGSRSGLKDDVEGSGLTIVENDPKKLSHKLFVILGNLKAGHTNVTHEDIQMASEILDIIKPQISAITYTNIRNIISSYINGRK